MSPYHAARLIRHPWRWPVSMACLWVLLVAAGCADHGKKINAMAERIYAGSSFNDPRPPRAFKSDGCSCWPDGDWLECCIRHDLLYWMGGTRMERQDADIALRTCVTEKGHPFIAQVMFIGIRIGGVWWLPTPFRWGFGWDYPDSGPPEKPY